MNFGPYLARGAKGNLGHGPSPPTPPHAPPDRMLMPDADPAPRTIPHGTLMAGRRGLIMGVANDHSLAWGIAAACAAQGAELAFTYQGEGLEKRVRPLATSVGATLIEACDVTDDASMDATFANIQRRRGAGSTSSSTPSRSPTSATCADAISTPRARRFCRRWTSRHSRSPPSAVRAAAMMRPGGSLLTLSYLGAERVVPHYNVMGDREGGARSVGALHGRRPRGLRHPGQRDQRRPDPHAGRQRHRRLSLHPALEPAERADGA